MRRFPWLLSVRPGGFPRSPARLALALAGIAACTGDADRIAGTGAGPDASRPPVTQAVTGVTNGRIAFSSPRDGNWEIYSMKSDGSDLVRLTNHPDEDKRPRWSPDGSRIAFVRSGPSVSGGSAIFIMNADGSNLVNITNGSGQDIQPDWSPDGSRFVFCSRATILAPVEIFVMNADGSGRTQVTNDGSADFEPAWSSDGTRIIFSKSLAGTEPDLFIMNADGSNQTNLTNVAGHDVSARWSPDGARIVYWHQDPQWDSPDIFVSGADGSNPTNLTNTPFEQDNAPAWSPDGSKIAFYSERRPAGSVVPGIYVMNADGSSPVALTDQYDTDPDWQPVPALHYAFTGFFPPVDNLPIVNLVKAGSGVPVKFSLGGNEGLNILRPGYPVFIPESCEAGVPQDPLETTTTNPGGLSYDASAGQYLYVWKTPKSLAGQCGRFVLGLKDGLDRVARFQFVR